MVRISRGRRLLVVGAEVLGDAAVEGNLVETSLSEMTLQFAVLLRLRLLMVPRALSGDPLRWRELHHLDLSKQVDSLGQRLLLSVLSEAARCNSFLGVS